MYQDIGFVHFRVAIFKFRSLILFILSLAVRTLLALFLNDYIENHFNIKTLMNLSSSGLGLFAVDYYCGIVGEI